MPALQFILTTAGKNAIVNANNTGTAPVVIDRVAVGSAAWTPTAAATALQAEIKKITAVGGGAVADDTIHVTANDSSTDVYTVREVGLYTNGNVLLAIYSQADPILTKGAGTVALIAADLVITGVPAGSVTVGDTTFDYPQATETVKGVAEIATVAETNAGTDDERIVTPLKLAQRTATTTRTGVIEIATGTEAFDGVDEVRAIVPQALKFVLDNRNASNSGTGLIQLATFVETLNGIDGLKAIVPSGLKYALDNRSATTAQTGLVELATSAEALTGTDTARAVTPSGLKHTLDNRSATLTSTGLIELATEAETQAGTDDTRAVTPFTLFRCNALFDRRGVIELATAAEVEAGTDYSRAVTPGTLRELTATTTRVGLIELATQAEADAGTDTTRAITPQTLRLHPGVARAWVVFNGSGTVSIDVEHNVTSITDRGVGRYTVNWDVDFGSSNYCYVASARQINDVSDSCTVSPRASESKSTGALQISVTEGADLQDSSEICVVAFA